MKKIQALLLTGLIVGATASGSFINANADLTPPQLGGSNIAFRNDGNNGQWGYYLDNINYANGPDAITYYLRTQDGTYYNYTNTTNIGGLTITQTYNRSNSGWIAYQGGPTYIPYLTNRIGSNNTVGYIKKVVISLNNQTNKDYQFFYDRSSSVNDEYFTVKYDNLSYGGRYTTIFFANTENLNVLYLPAYTELSIELTTLNTEYLDAFYLNDLGTSAAWQDGYDLGYGTGESDTLIGLNGGNIFTIIGDAFGAVSSVMNIQVLPNLSIGIIFGAWIAILILFNILNVANGTPKSGGKK